MEAKTPEELAEALPDDPLEALIQTGEAFLAQFGTGNAKQYISQHDLVLSYYSLIEAIHAVYEFPFEWTDLQVGSNKGENIYQISTLISNLKTQAEEYFTANRVKIDAQKFTHQLEAKRGNAPRYQIPDPDFQKIQENINALRDLITVSTVFPDDHKRRLLKRLERLQSEVHKNMSDLTVALGGLVDIGIAIGKFGRAVKPMVDRVREMLDIISNAKSAAERLPHGDSPLQLEEPRD